MVSSPSLPRLSDAADRLVRGVKFRDIEGFVKHANLNLELFREADPHVKYLGEAIGALIERRQAWARNCVEKFLLVKECSKLTTAGRVQFLQKLYNEDDVTVDDFDEKFDRTMHYCRTEAEKRQHGVPEGRRERMPSDFKQEMEDVNRHTSGLVIGKGKTRESSPPARARPDRHREDSEAGSENDEVSELRRLPPRHEHSTSYDTKPRARERSDSKLDDSRHSAEPPAQLNDVNVPGRAQPDLTKTPSFRGEGPRARLEERVSFKLDPAYRKLDFRAAGQFFKVGRVFAILEHSEDNRAPQQRSNDAWTTETSSGIVILSHVRRFIVVKDSAHGFCWAVGISTYGGQGTKKHGFNKADREAHAIAYSTGHKAARLQDEAKLPKDPIEIHPVSRAGHVERLDVASRIDFARVRTVEHNVRVKNIGEVAQNSLPYLRQYWLKHRNE